MSPGKLDEKNLGNMSGHCSACYFLSGIREAWRGHNSQGETWVDLGSGWQTFRMYSEWWKREKLRMFLSPDLDLLERSRLMLWKGKKGGKITPADALVVLSIWQYKGWGCFVWPSVSKVWVHGRRVPCFWTYCAVVLHRERWDGRGLVSSWQCIKKASFFFLSLSQPVG